MTYGRPHLNIKRILVFFAFIFGLFIGTAQEDTRTLLRGKVLYRNSNVPDQNVINSTSERATITNDNGEFAIWVKEKDQLVFTSVNYEIEVVNITAEIIANNRLVIEVTEKVTALDEVVVSPENQKEFLELKNEEFKGFEYETDQTSEIENIALDPTVRGMKDGLNFVNIFKALYKVVAGPSTAEKPPLLVSDVLRQIYDDEFFLVDLKLTKEQIDPFLYYCDEKLPAPTLLRKDNEFELIDFLITQSESFKEEITSEN